MALRKPGPAACVPSPGCAVRIAETALFLDVDGTLLEIAPTPDEVVVGTDLVALLRALALSSNGAAAFVSGRSIAALDSLFQPLMLPAAGLHGFERIVEETTDIVARLGSEFELLRGRRVVEIRPAVAHKAAAIVEFMQEICRRSRRPACGCEDCLSRAHERAARAGREIFEHALRACNSLGLLSERIDPQSIALWGNFPHTAAMVGIIGSAARLSRPWEGAI
jgi:hypothetical protein